MLTIGTTGQLVQHHRHKFAPFSPRLWLKYIKGYATHFGYTTNHSRHGDGLAKHSTIVRETPTTCCYSRSFGSCGGYFLTHMEAKTWQIERLRSLSGPSIPTQKVPPEWFNSCAFDNCQYDDKQLADLLKTWRPGIIPLTCYKYIKCLMMHMSVHTEWLTAN